MHARMSMHQDLKASDAPHLDPAALHPKHPRAILSCIMNVQSPRKWSCTQMGAGDGGSSLHLVSSRLLSE